MVESLHPLLKTKYPLIQAPMAGSQGARLAVAVSEAGAMGSLPCAMLSPQALRSELEVLRSQTSRPWNLNFFAHSNPPPDPQREAAWRELLAPYHREFGTEPAPPGGARSPFSDELADIVEEGAERGLPAVVSFHFGLPEPRLLARVRIWGSKVIASATTVAEARWLEDHGVDAVIAQGLEAGGHRGHFLPHAKGDDPADPAALLGQAGSFALLPQIVDAVLVPVIAAGGICTAQGVAAARALGASAVQIGTAFLLCPEADTSPLHRAALRAARDDRAGRPTALTNLFTGRPARGLVNRLMAELGPINGNTPPFPLAGAALAPLRAEAERRGNSDFSPLWAGQNVSGCSEDGAAEVTRRLAAGW
ncbi:NAD(P)H-dependent flavin oxidoreductase [Piscinibacter sakaiensis]|uniref:NAD(P)H-dependent flavin oxidoreductase n=1 Tax=Piscinibacter sakaiensis TaxID=1547922 RepID=UPI003AABD794